MPHNLEAEEAVLGALLIDSASYYEVAFFLRPDDFYREKNRWIYEARQAIKECDQITMSHELAKRKQLEAAGGAAYLSHLVAQCPTSVHIVHYAQVLHNLGNARRLVSAGGRISELGYKQDPDSLIKAFKEIVALKEYDKEVIDPQAFSDYSLKYFSELSSGELKPVTFGLKSLDDMGGLQPGEYAILGGETSVGKTTLMNQIARHQHPKPVLFCTTEMTRAQWARREVARLRKIPMALLGNPIYVQQYILDILQSVEDLKKGNIHILTGSITPQQIYIEAVQIPDLSLIIVDYLQRLKGVEASYQSTSIASRELADMAKDLEIPIVVSSQLSRDFGKEGEKKPILSRLKDSGNIENDADVVLIINRKRDAKIGTKDYLLAKLTVAKHKQGGEYAEIELIFNPSTQQYDEA